MSYRPFDLRFTYYTGKSKGFHCMPRGDIMRNMFLKVNIAINLVKVGRDCEHHNYFLSRNITDKGLISSLDNTSCFPLYLYPETSNQQTTEKQERVPNLNMEIVSAIEKKLGLAFVPENQTEGETCFANNSDLRPEFRQNFAPIDLLDYIYAVLHTPA